MKVFIVGIAGGIGSRPARLLTATGDQADGLYRRSEQGQYPAHATMLVGSAATVARRGFGEVDTILARAAENPR